MHKRTIIHRGISWMCAQGLLAFLPDSLYVRLLFWGTMGETLDLKAPKTFNEKLQWLKLYDRKPIYSLMVDKYEVKQLIADSIGKEYVIPTLGVWNTVDEINFDELPNQFVLKCTHDSGGLIICRDKSQLDIGAAKKQLNRYMKRKYFYWAREWPYKNVAPRIIAETFLTPTNCNDLRDYKFFCFGGKARFYKVDFDRFVGHRANYYDLENHLLPFGEVICPPDPTRKIDIPQSIDHMRQLAEQLSVNIPFIRVDFYDMDGQIYFGEMTFFPAAGFGRFEPEKWDAELGAWLELPQR